MKLTIEHLAPYLPYGLKINTPNGTRVLKGIDTCMSAVALIYWIDGKSDQSFHIDCQPILRPLSKEFLYSIIAHDEDVEDVLEAKEDDTLEYIRHDLFKTIVANHGDIFGLIEKGLAIDINTLESEATNG